MKNWSEQEWRLPRMHEVVKDENGNTGYVSKTSGPFNERKLWIRDKNELEIYSEQDPKLFTVCNQKETKDFQIERYENLGFKRGLICVYKEAHNIPIEIQELDWNSVRMKMSCFAYDRRTFKSAAIKVADVAILSPFESTFPRYEDILSEKHNGLKYRIEVNLVEKNNPGWSNEGSPWEFIKKEDALNEIFIWEARLKIRRIASVLNIGWKIQFPCWTVEFLNKDGTFLTRAKEVYSFNGSCAYFKTAAHAVLAAKMIKPEVWLNSVGVTIDELNF